VRRSIGLSGDAPNFLKFVLWVRVTSLQSKAGVGIRSWREPEGSSLGIFDRFNSGARAMLSHAQLEAIFRDHTQITPAHLLMGMMHERESVAAEALRKLGLSESALVLVLDDGPAEWTNGVTGEPVLSNRSKKLLEHAVDQWRHLNHDQIGTAHILLGLCREEELRGSGILQDLGLAPTTVRTEVHVLFTKRGPEHSTTSRVSRFSNWIVARSHFK
jgi:ATP-dependent Clp protease ATP-binding subunit ClpA